MTLGSPVSGSTGGGIYQNQPQTGPQYLPGFLMGDTTVQVSPDNVVRTASEKLNSLSFREVGAHFKQAQ